MLELPPDPWQWPDLTAEQLRELSGVRQESGPKAPLFQYDAVRRCNALKPEIDIGSGFAVLAAVRICGTSGLVMPPWLVYAFNRRYDVVLNYNAISWDDPLSFGRPYPKGTQIKAQHKKRHLQFAVLNAVDTILQSEPNTPIDKGLFERVGEPLNVGSTLAEEYYYAAKKISDSLDKSALNDALLGPYVVSSAQNTAKNPKPAGRR